MNINPDYSLRSDKFTFKDHQSSGFSLSNWLKKLLGIGFEQRMSFKTHNGETSIAIRHQAPSLFESKWVKVNYGKDQGVYLNISSISKRSGLNEKQINSGNLTLFLNQLTTSPLDSDKIEGIDLEEAKKSFDELEIDANIDLPEGSEKLVTAQQMQDAVDYLDDASNAEELKKLLAAEHAKGNPYVVLLKEKTGLSHNIEYHGPKEAFLRFLPDFAKGNSKWVSKLVDLYDRELISKNKLFCLQEGEDENEVHEKADAYLKVRNANKPAERRRKHTYRILNSSILDDIKAEAYLCHNIPTSLQTRKVVAYTKEHTDKNNRLHSIKKAAIYTLLQRGSISNLPKDKPEILKQIPPGIVNGMADLHKNRICHNDPKSENFLWTYADKLDVKVIDFGFSKSFNAGADLEDCRNFYRNSGTPRQLPPEFYDAAFEVPEDLDLLFQYNKAKDAYAVGITLYNEIYGCKLPWEDLRNNKPVDNRAVLQSMRNTKPLQDRMQEKNVPAPIQNMILGLMHPDPLQRMTLEAARRLAKV